MIMRAAFTKRLSPAGNFASIAGMKAERWLHIIPVALIMYTISYIDRTNVALASDPKLSSLMTDLGMDDKIKEELNSSTSALFSGPASLN